MIKKALAVVALVTGIVFISCNKPELKIAENPVVLPAGENCSTYDNTSYAYSFRIKGLTPSQNSDFFVGNSFFNQNWVESPASTTARDGLGPLFNNASCSGCHFRDGRGEPLSGLGLLLRLSNGNGSGPEAVYGGQFQDRGISTADAEGDLAISYVEVQGAFLDGTPYSLRVPTYDMVNLHYGPMDPNVMVSPRVGPSVFGLGLLEIISEADLLAHADEFDADGDGISGKANYVYDPYYGDTRIGRFGWKSNKASIPSQVAGAFNGDLGIKTSYFPDENHTSAQSALDALANGGVVEIENDDLEKVILYCRTLAVPIRRDTYSDYTVRGESLFNTLSCNKCHVAEYKTSSDGDIEPLKNQTIRPYSDLLLHDMGPDLADNRPDGLASGNEWRTPPLWGIGLLETVNGHTFLLHDGRARNIEEAILWHGGEAQKSKEMYLELSAEKRQQLLTFLRTL